MTWQITSFALLTLALGGGMLWYERSRPPSQVVALVAVLAALAVAGRIVLAPIPNVVATTDIVLIAGYVLGPAAGFAVGAIGGLVSNFWLGQGAWTPWQMLGWGLTGIAGAALWKLSSGRTGRITLAAVCGLAGLAFGALMNLQTMVSYGGDMSLARYLALEARAIPFDIAHMTGNIIFALIAGPAMIAALTRFRERFEWRSVTQPVGVALIALSFGAILFGGAGTDAARAAPTVPKEATSAATWLRTQQNDDGGFPMSADMRSAVTFTARSMIGFAAAGVNPRTVKTNDKSPYNYLVSQKKKIDKPGDLALTILAVHAAGMNPKDFDGRNLVKDLRNRQQPGGWVVIKDGGMSIRSVNGTAMAALAFRAAGAHKSAENAVRWLYSTQALDGDGGWGISPGADSDLDSTATALMAIPAGATQRVGRAIKFLGKLQRSSGGFWNSEINSVNSQSTALAVLGQLAAGKSPNRLKSHGHSGLDFLVARQNKDGSVWYSKDSDQTRPWVTADALPALAKRKFPVSAPPMPPKPKPEDNSGSTAGTGTTYNPGPGNISSSSPSSGSSSPSPKSGSGGSGSSKGNPGPSSSGPSGPPSTGTTVPVPTVIPVVPSEALLAASAPGPSPSPLLAILICLVVSGGLCGGTILLVRRLRW